MSAKTSAPADAGSVPHAQERAAETPKHSPVATAKSAARNLAKRGATAAVLGWELPRAYARAAAEAPADPARALFVTDRTTEPPPYFAPMMDYLDARGAEVRFLSLGRNGASLRQHNERMLHFAHEIAQAGAVFCDGPCEAVGRLPLRPETVCVDLWADYGMTDEPPSDASLGQPGYAPAAATERIAARAMPAGALREPEARTALERLSALDPEGIDITVVIPAYNAAGTLERAVDSVLGQPYPPARMEVLVVDDCSTDATHAIAERYERDRPGAVRALSTPANSGSGAAPRNVGLEHARGTYVFFLDADDWLGQGAVPAMLTHALDWGSDVLLVRMVGERGRRVPTSMFNVSRREVDVYRSKVMWTLGPTKLFRRGFVERCGLRFPEGVMPEDILFTLRAYVMAGRVSAASDRDYYHCAYADGPGDGVEGAHLSVGTWRDLDANLRAFADIFAFVDAHVPDGERDWALMRRLFARDCYNMLVSLAHYSRAEQPGYLHRIRSMFAPRYRRAVRPGLEPHVRATLDKALSKDEHAALAAVRALRDLPQARPDEA